MNLPLLLIPILTKKTPNSKLEDIKTAITCHWMVIQLISKSFSKILSLNHPLPALSNATLCTTIMAITNTAEKTVLVH